MYPLVRFDERRLPADYDGVVVTCDVDKTYLDTAFESWRSLAVIPLEWAEDKRTVPGMAAALRGIRFGPGDANAQTPFYFLTASPPFLRKTLTRKTLLDGVQSDGATFKDWRRIILRGRPAWLGRQLAYKLCALLHQRSLLPSRASEILVGDDVESDATAYAIYAELLAGGMNMDRLSQALTREGCDDEERREAMDAASALTPGEGGVRRIYVMLYAASDPGRFASLGTRVVCVRSAFQLAAHLAVDGFLRSAAAAEASRDLAARKPGVFDAAQEIEDGIRRGLFTRETLESVGVRA